MYLKYDAKEDNATMGMPKARTIAAAKIRSAVPGKERDGIYFDSDDPVNPDDDEEDCEPLADDVYAFIVAAPVFSPSFIFAVYVIMLKYIVYSILAYGIEKKNLIETEISVQVVKFFLIPVAIAMQEDLIHTYASVANITYSEEALEFSQSATKCKLVFSFVMRLIDGIFSLAVNFAVMMTTNEVLDVFLNFAALHFLQSIDDVFFDLVEQGFFGDGMEHMSNICKKITFPRRTTEHRCIKSLDSILLGATFLVLFATYCGVVVHISLSTPPNFQN